MGSMNDDVREALAIAVEDVIGSDILSSWKVADAILSRFDVTPKGQARADRNIEHHRLAGRILRALHLLTPGQIARMPHGALADHIAFRLRQESEAALPAMSTTPKGQASQPVTEEQVEAMCEVMHDAYERAAASEGWETQERSRKPWAEVPEANRRTMRVAVRAVLEAAREAGR